MYISFPIQMTIYMISAVMSIAIIAFFLIKGRRSPLLYSFILFQIVVLLWLIRIIVLKLMLRFNQPLGNYYGAISFEYYELYHYKLKHFIVCITGFCWLIFCLLYTGRDIKKDKRLIIFLVLISPVVFYLPVSMYDNWYKYGQEHKLTLFWLHVIARYTYYAIGVAVLIKWSIKQIGNIRKQTILLALSICIPILLNFFQDYKRFIQYTGGIIYDFDVTPVGFIITMIVIAFVTYKYRFLDIVPIALRRLVNNMNQAIVVVDSFNKIVDYNNSFLTTFKEIKSIKKNIDFEIIIKDLKTVIVEDDASIKALEILKDKTCEGFKGEICLAIPEFKYLSVDMQSLKAKRKEILVRVISFNDISEYKKLMNEVNEKNLELTNMYEQIKEYASAVEELTITKERNRFARDIHDTLGHTLTLLIALLEVSNITCGKDNEKTREKLKKALIVSREGLKEVRRSISGLAPGKLDSESLVNSLDKLISDFRTSEVSIDFTVDGIEGHMNRMTLEVLYRSCQEAMTNSIRHGNARHIEVILKFNLEKLKLFIIDDGSGCKKIKKGFGLSGMEQRIDSLGGTVVLGSDGECGFNVHIEVPLKNWH